jgi:hypothetical protein
MSSYCPQLARRDKLRHRKISVAVGAKRTSRNLRVRGRVRGVLNSCPAAINLHAISGNAGRSVQADRRHCPVWH